MSTVANWYRRTRQGVVAVTGTGAGASLVLALLVLLTVFVAIATPRASLSYRTRALQQQLAAIPPAGQAVVGSVDLPTLGGALGPFGQPQTSDINRFQFYPIGAAFERNLRAIGLPLEPRLAWWGMNTSYISAPGANKSAYNGATEPEVELIARSELSRHARLVAGRLPGASYVSPHLTSARFQVAVTTYTAAKFSVRPGSTIRLIDDQGGLNDTIVLEVTGIVAPVGQKSAFWTADSNALRPSYNSTALGGGYWLGSAIVANSEINNLESAVSFESMRVTWDFPLALGGVTANQAPALNNELSAGLTGASVVTSGLPSPLSVPLSAGVGSTINAFVLTQNELGSLLALLYVSLTVVGLVVLLLGARLLAERRAAELILVQARGAGRTQLVAVSLRAAAITVIPAAAVAALIAAVVTPGQDEPLAWWLGGLTVIVALVAVPWLAVRRAWRAGPAADRADSAPPGRSRLRQAVYDVAAIAVAVGGLIVLRLQGPPSASGTDWLTAAAPILVAVPVAVIVVRGYPIAIRALVRLTGRRRGVTAFVGLARATRASGSSVLPAFALVLALGVIAFGAMLRTAVVTGDVAQSWRELGADAVISASGANKPLTPAVLRSIEKVPGVLRATSVTAAAGATANGATLGVIIVNPKSYANFVARTPARRFRAGPLAEPSGGTAPGSALPALASPGAAAALGHLGLLLGAATLRVKIVGDVRSTPGIPEDGPFLVVPSWAVDRAVPTRPPPDEVLIVGQPDQGRLAAVVSRELSGSATITYRSSVLAGLTSAALPHGAYVTFARAAVAAAAFGAIILLIMLALGARPREMTLARLFTMGLTRGQARGLMIAESLPAILAATVGGAVCAWALVPLVGTSISLAPFTGSGVSVPVRPEYPVIGYLAGCLVVLALLTLFGQAAATRLRGVSRALRVGE